MKIFEQDGANLRRTHLGGSGNICECCQVFDHAAREYMPDDIECPSCGQLCCCKCHR